MAPFAVDEPEFCSPMATCSGAPPVFVKVMSCEVCRPSAALIETVPGVTFNCPARSVMSACTTESATAFTGAVRVAYRSAVTL